MNKISHLLLLLTILSAWSCNQTNIDNLDLERYEAEIVEFDRESQYRGVPTGAVVILGGATVRNWQTLTSQLQGMPARNRGFGEATLLEIIRYFRRLTDPFQPEVLVLHAGSNDILLGATPEEVVQSFNEFLTQITISHRASRVVYISMIPFPAHRRYWPDFEAADQLIRQVADQNSRVAFVDIRGEFLNSEGEAIDQLFEADGRRLNATGYARLSAAVVPVVSSMF